MLRYGSLDVDAEGRLIVSLPHGMRRQAEYLNAARVLYAGAPHVTAWLGGKSRKPEELPGCARAPKRSIGAMSGRQYLARIAPLVTPLDVPADTELGMVRESFERDAFTGTEPREVPVILRHDPGRVVGHLDRLFRSGGWHCASFRLDASIARSAIAEELLQPGSPVSIGFDVERVRTSRSGVVRQYTLVRLNELSVLERGDRPVYPGARVVSVIPLERGSNVHREDGATRHVRRCGEVLRVY